MAAFHGILAEDLSDAETMAVLVRRLREGAGLPRIRVKPHGYEGCGQLLRKGAAQLKAWELAGYRWAVVCYDTDKDEPVARQRRVELDIIKKSGVSMPCCPVLPVQEIEAWILADVEKLQLLFNWCRDLRQPALPESINDPKEYLRELTRHPEKKKYLYDPPRHNAFMAEHLDLAAVESRCPSFAPLAAFVKQVEG